MKTIMLVDDESHIRLYLKTALTRAGFNIIAEAKDGHSAVEFYKDNQPELILLDVSMPFMSGIETLQEIMKINTSAKIMMLTSMSDMETVSQCIELGAISYIRKDTDIKEIIDVINRIIGSSIKISDKIILG